MQSSLAVSFVLFLLDFFVFSVCLHSRSAIQQSCNIKNRMVNLPEG
jgi:hypothetical protein